MHLITKAINFPDQENLETFVLKNSQISEKETENGTADAEIRQTLETLSKSVSISGVEKQS